DAERERRDGGQREAWRLAEDTGGVAQILDQILDEVGAAHIATVLLRGFERSEGSPGREARVGRAQACGELFFHELFDMDIQLALQRRVDGGTAQQGAEAVEKNARESHGRFLRGGVTFARSAAPPRRTTGPSCAARVRAVSDRRV